MSRASLSLVVLLAAWACAASAFSQPWDGNAGDDGDRSLVSPLSDDPRSTILLRYDCRSDIGRREVALFADGVVRLRQAEPDEDPDAKVQGERMRLHTLDPDSLAAYRARIADEDLSEAEVERSPVEGEWVERCTLEVLREGPAGPDGPPTVRRFRFSRFSALPLSVSRLVRVAEELAAEAGARSRGGLPPDYEPRAGDLLERADGELFEVVAYTIDGKGVELVGRSTPLTIYLAPDTLRERFVRLVSRAGEASDRGTGRADGGSP